MRKGTWVVLLMLAGLSTLVAQPTLREHSYSELVEMIQNESDSVFSYSDAIIRFNPEKDQRFKVYYKSTDSVFIPFSADSLIIDKHLELNNVHFLSTASDLDSLNGQPWSSITGVFYKTSFKKNLQISSTLSFRTINSTLGGKSTRIMNLDFVPPPEVGNIRWQDAVIQIDNCLIKTDFNIDSFWKEEINESRIYFRNNESRLYQHIGNFAFQLRADHLTHLALSDNLFRNNAPNHISIQSARWVAIRDNTFSTYTELNLFGFYDWNRLQFLNNDFQNYVQLSMLSLPETSFFDWNQLENSLVSGSGFGPYITDLYDKDARYLSANRYTAPFLQHYFDSVRYTFRNSYIGEMAFRGMLHEHYKAKYDNEQANAAFISLKDLETKRLKYLHQLNPTFRTYFKVQINQFLKLFVDYGTEPAKAIVMAVYVIMAFALIYLFFPNHWDSHGKERIKHRFLFFYKYLSLNKGIHDVYLEERQDEIENNEQFLKVINAHKDDVPRFFYLAAMPIYKWSVAGTRLYSRLLRRVDFLKGTWKETDKKVRPFKTLLVVVMFVIAIGYDLFIKVLNAVMLSINTFTTLGFGEIPIKGLPRYLAIIQGFIGWFMLTIFSVSLISQLLN